MLGVKNMYKEFSDYLRYSNLRQSITQERLSDVNKSLYAQALLSLKCDITKMLNDKITFLAWLEFNDRFFDKLDEKEQRFLCNVFTSQKEGLYSDEINQIFETNKYRRFYDKKIERIR